MQSFSLFPKSEYTNPVPANLRHPKKRESPRYVAMKSAVSVCLAGDDDTVERYSDGVES